MTAPFARLDLASLPLRDLRTLADAINHYRHYARRQKVQATESRCNAFKHNPSGEPRWAAQADAWQAEEERCRRLWEIVRELHNAEVRRLKAELEPKGDT